MTAAAVASLLSGCSTISRYSESDAAFKQSGPIAKSTATPGSAKVAVRWPQAVTPAAQELIKPNWMKNYSGVLYDNDVTLGLMGDGLRDSYRSIPNGSVYYAAEFTRLLGQYIAPGDIVLEPVVLDARDGKLVYTPMVRNRFPVAMTVTLWDTPPALGWSIAGWAHVVGSVVTSGLASPRTCGVLAFKPAKSYMPAYDAAACANLDSREVPAPDPVYGFAGSLPSFNVNIPTRGLPISADAAVPLPQTYETFEEGYHEESAAADFDARKKLKNPMLDNLARIVADGLGHIDQQRAVQVAFGRYVALYDAGLAQRMAAGQLVGDDQARLELITKLADAERKWVSTEDAHVVDKILDGSFGKSFRAERLAQKKYHEKRELMGWASVFAMAGANIAAGAGNLQMGNTMAMQTMMDYTTGNDQANAAFYQQFGDEAAARDQFIVIELSGKTIRLKADSRQKLAEETLAIYRAQLAPPVASVAGKTSSQPEKPSKARKPGASSQ